MDISDVPAMNLRGETFPGLYLISLFHTLSALKPLLIVQPGALQDSPGREGHAPLPETGVG